MATTAQHTPGPWRISGFESRTESPHRVVMGVDDFSIAHVGERDKDENIANARLIAAAPDLLEACKEALPEITNHEYGHHAQFQSVADQLRAAISKAEGK